MTFEEILAREGKLVYRTKGTSMEPMLRQNRDLITVEVPSARLARFDVALYKRGDSNVLHRVIRVKDGCYLIRGDNTFSLEEIPFERVFGVLTAFVRKGKHHSVTEKGYRVYVRFWNAIYPLRWLWQRIRRGLIRLMKKLGILPFIKRMLHR